MTIFSLSSPKHNKDSIPYMLVHEEEEGKTEGGEGGEVRTKTKTKKVLYTKKKRNILLHLRRNQVLGGVVWADRRQNLPGRIRLRGFPILPFWIPVCGQGKPPTVSHRELDTTVLDIGMYQGCIHLGVQTSMSGEGVGLGL